MAIKKIKSTFGSAEKFYATVYLIARNEHHCQMMGVAGAEQRLKTIHAYQGMIRFMLDEEGLNGKPVSDVSVGIFDVPASMQSNEQLEIKIGKGNEKVTPHIYEVRLVAE